MSVLHLGTDSLMIIQKTKSHFLAIRVKIQNQFTFSFQILSQHKLSSVKSSNGEIFDARLRQFFSSLRILVSINPAIRSLHTSISHFHSHSIHPLSIPLQVPPAIRYMSTPVLPVFCVISSHLTSPMFLSMKFLPVLSC